MSEAVSEATSKVDIRRHIEEIQREADGLLRDVKHGSSPEEIDLAEARLQSLIRRQSEQLSNNVYLSGDNVLELATASSLLTTAWISFLSRKETLYDSRQFSQKLTLTEVLDALDTALSEVISTGRESGV